VLSGAYLRYHESTAFPTFPTKLTGGNQGQKLRNPRVLEFLTLTFPPADRLKASRASAHTARDESDPQ
jgi:hypothetical protein